MLVVEAVCCFCIATSLLTLSGVLDLSSSGKYFYHANKK